MKTYEVTWRRSKNNQYPTDEYPFRVRPINFWLVKATTRRETWRYEIEDGDSTLLEHGLDQAPSVVRYRTVKA